MSDETDEILAALEKQAQDIAFERMGTRFAERDLANILACLLAALRHERTDRKTLEEIA